MKRLIFKLKKEEGIITELSVLNYQEMLIEYQFQEVNKRILNYVIQFKVNDFNITFEEIEYKDELIINHIFNLKQLFYFLEINMVGIKVNFKSQT